MLQNSEFHVWPGEVAAPKNMGELIIGRRIQKLNIPWPQLARWVI